MNKRGCKQGLKKRVEKLNLNKKKVESQGDNNLSKPQLEVLKLLTKQFMPIKKIAKQRGVTVQATYKTLKQLRQKGYITRSFTKGLKFVTGTTLKHERIRLHGQQFAIGIISQGQLYKKIRSYKTMMIFEGHTVILNKKSIIVSCNELFDFCAETADAAMIKSMEYWTQYFFRLQDRLNLIILKGENSRIKMFNAHFAEKGNELAKEAEKKKYDIKIFTNEDSKLWFVIDKSWNINEAETVHSDTSMRDMQEVVQPFFNDLRDKQHIPLSKISEYMADTTYQINEISSGLKAVVNYLESQLPKKKELDQDQKGIPDYFG